MAQSTLPFKQKEIYLGFAEISGLLRLVKDTLEIEYQVKDTTLGFLDSSVKTCYLPFRIIESIEVEKKWLSGKLEIIFNRIPDLDNPFQLDNHRLELSVKKGDMERAKAFRSALMYEILEGKMDQVDGADLDRDDQEPIHKRSAEKRQRPRRSSSFDTSGGLKNILREE